MDFAVQGFDGIEQIHESRNSVVFRARRSADNLPVILKLLRNDHPAAEDTGKFRREYEMTRSNQVEGIIGVHALVEQGTRLIMVLEDFGGDSLSHILRSDRPPLDEILRVSVRITGILELLFRNSIMHKDINPSNILWNRLTDEVRIIDLGIATSLPRENPEVCSPNVLEGTLPYVSPEQTGRMNRSMDYRTDLYSLGITLYELLTGSLPFATDDAMEMIHCHIAKTARPVCEIDRFIPETLSDIIAKLMSKRAEDRYQSAFGLKADLQNCLDQLASTGIIRPFEIGKNDFSTEFQIPQKLYGREEEISDLLESFGRVCSGATEMIMVSGYAGIGKTALVHEIHKSIIERHGYFISGKFDQFKRDIPYDSLIQAFQELIRQFLTEREDHLGEWRQKILSALGRNGQVIIDVIPELELIIGKQPAVPDLPGAESQNRFNLVFQNYIRALAAKDNPLVIFLDDLQWADLPSLKLIELFMTNPETGHTLIIGAFRDNETGPTHPLPLMLDELRKRKSAVSMITLKPLVLPHVNELVSETLKHDTDTTLPLAELCFSKTQGNPFFLTQFLISLYKEGIIEFNPPDSAAEENRDSCGWHWDIDRIARMDITNNVVDLMVGKIRKLPEKSQQILKLAACIGSRFDLRTLSVVSEKSAVDTIDDLWQAIREGLVLPVNYVYKFLHVPEEVPKVSYRFLHDRVQQAAYSLIPEPQKKEVHLRIGRLLLGNPMDDTHEELLFTIVNHLNHGIELISDESEKERLAALNLSAGRKAKTSAAYAPAFIFFKTGIGLLPMNCWDTRYDLALSLHEQAAEAAYLNTEFEEMDLLVNEVMTHSRSLNDKIHVYDLKVQSYFAQNQPGKAIGAARESLKLLGVKLPKKTTNLHLLLGLAKIRLALKGKEEDELIDLPEMKDPKILAAMRIISGSAGAFYTLDAKETGMLVLTTVYLSLKYGNCPGSAYGYMNYGVVLSSFHDFERAYRFGRVGMKLMDKYQARDLDANIYLSYHTWIKHWKDPLRESLPLMREGYQKGLDSGNLQYASWIASVYCYFLFFCGIGLEKTLKEMDSFCDALAQFKQETTLNYIRLIRRVVRALAGCDRNSEGRADPCLSDDEQETPASLQKDRLGTFLYYVNNLILSYLYQRHDLAEENAGKAIRYYSPAMIQSAMFHYYRALNRLAMADTASPSEKKILLKKVSHTLKKLRKWAHHAPMNYCHRLYLMEAEKARVMNRDMDAIKNYDLSIKAARDSEYIHEEALANELALKFWLSRGNEDIARTFLTRAICLYQSWGAFSKVDSLREAYKHLIAPAPDGTDKDIMITTTHMGTLTSDSTSSSLLDLASVVKASQAISSEVVLERLLDKLMKILLENAGAEEGLLILKNAEKLMVTAHITAGAEKAELFDSLSVDDCSMLSHAIVHYAFRTQSNVVLQDAAKEDMFRQDPYVARKRPSSILCMPILHHGEIVSILYLENNRLAGAFTPDRVEVLNILSSQAAISIQNALLYAENKKTEKSIRDSEVKHRSILEEMEDTYCETDLKGHVTFANPSTCRMLGYSKDELMGMHFKNFSAPDEIEMVKKYYLEIFQTGVPGKPFYWNLVRKDGEAAFIEIRTSLMKDMNGNPIGFRGLGRDITERSKVEKALRESEEKYRSILEDMEDNFCETDLAGNVTYINPSICKVTGYSSEELTGMNFRDFTAPDDIPMIMGYYGEIYKTGRPGKPFYWKVMRKNGEYGVFEIVATLIRDKNGNPKGFRGLGRDLTERKKAEEELKKAEAKYRGIFDNAVEGLFQVMPREDRFLSANQAAATLLGYDSPEDMISSITDIVRQIYVNPEDREKLGRILRKQGKAVGFETPVYRKDGTIFQGSLSLRMVMDQNNNFLYYEGSIVDITEHMQKEKAEREREAAEAATRAKGEFLASMSHEIRTPMNGVIGMTGLLSETDLSPEQRDYTETIKDSAESLLSIINDILDFSKIEAGKLDLETIDFNLRTVVEGVIDILAFRAHEKGILLACIIDSEVPMHLRGDPVRLRQIITNLVGNAIKFTQTGEVVLHVTPKEDQGERSLIYFSVNDTGIGIPADKINMLFRAFTQVDTSTSRRYGGTGLGLSISKLLTEMMGGRIGAESELGKGSTFWFSIPFGRQPEQEGAVDADADVVGKRVLVIESNETYRRVILSILKSWNCRYEEAADASDAVKKLMSAAALGDPFRISVIDSLIPDMGGESLARRIKEDPATEETSLIMMMPMGKSANASAFEHSGIAACIARPVKQSSLFNAMMSALGRTESKETGHAVLRDAGASEFKSKVKILLAEDNIVNQKVALKILEKMGYSADVAETGTEVIRALEKTPYDLVLMDVEMPEMDGIEATRIIRSPESSVLNHDIHIIAMTAHAMKRDMDRCLEAGMNDYVSKPIQIKELREAIEQAAKPDIKGAAEKDREVSPLQASMSPLIERSPVFDREQFLEHIGGDEQFMSEIIDIFLKDSVQQIILLEEALQKADASKIHLQAHTLKGACSNICATALKEAAFEMEKAAKAGDLSKTDHYMQRIREEFSRFQETISG